MKIEEYRLVFWDFDGVVKESLDVKADAFVRIFGKPDTETGEKIRAHHAANGGVSRFRKIPLYAEWAKIVVDDEQVERLCDKFSKLVVQGVISSPWVPGVENYLRKNVNRQKFILITATPQKEIEFVLRELDLESAFANVYGSPIPKAEAIRKEIASGGYNIKECLVIGDSRTDFDAAQQNDVDFLLRLHGHNADLLAEVSENKIKDFREYG